MEVMRNMVLDRRSDYITVVFFGEEILKVLEREVYISIGKILMRAPAVKLMLMLGTEFAKVSFTNVKNVLDGIMNTCSRLIFLGY